MYNQYWGFRRSPFPGTLDPERFYESPNHEEAMARLSYVVDEGRQGAVIIGPAGVGKSLIVEVFARRIRRPNREVVIARCPALGGRELFFELCQEFGLAPEPGADDATLWRRLREHVIANRVQDCQTVIVIDQAHLLAESAAQLRAIHMLYCLDPHPAARLTVILAARPDLMRHARNEVLEWVDLGVAIEPFHSPQTLAYIPYLTGWAGRTEPAFSADAIGKIHELTNGVPRHINRVCDLALLAGATEELTQVSEVVVESVYKELNPDVPGGPLSIAV